jgi:hypothetical protein
MIERLIADTSRKLLQQVLKTRLTLDDIARVRETVNTKKPVPVTL